MYARVLRKWSLAKFLMYLWLPVMMLLVIWCQGAASMHLTAINGGAPISQFQQSPAYILGSTYSNDNQQKRARSPDYHNSLSQLYNHRQTHPRHSGYAAAAASNAAASFVPNVPKLNSQIIINNRNFNINHSYSSNNSRNLITSANINLILNGRKYKRHVQDQQIYNTPATSIYTMRGGSTRRFYPTEPTRITRSPIYPVRQDNVQIRQGYTSLQRTQPYRLNRNDQTENVGSRIIDIVTTSASTSTIAGDSSSPNLTTNRLITMQNENENKNIGLNESLRRDNEQYRNINATPPDQAEWLHAQREKRIRNESLRRRLIREHILPNIIQNDRNNYSRHIQVNNTRDTTLRRSNSDGSLNSLNNSYNINTSSNTVRHMSDSDLDELMIGRNRRDSRYYPSSISSWQVSSSGNRQRKRPRRYCSARDPTQLAFEAPTVFEGKVRSMSSDRRRNFSVTFEVKEVYKKQISYALPSLLRLQFTYRNTTSECDIYREHLRPRGLVRDELEQGRIYILFVQQIDIGNFTILGTPVKKTRRAVNAVKIGVSKDYAQPASIKSLTANRSNRTVIQEGEELRIVCKVKGQPPPKVTWFKDDKSINRNRKMYQFIHLKKRSELVISSFKTTDAGHYECRAKNKVTKKPDRRVIRIDAAQKPTRRNEETFSHLTGDQCPEEWQAYCLNGATCKYFKDVSLCSCTCPDGYIGDRCQTKEPTTFEPSTYNPDQHQCGINKFYGSYYC